MNRFVIEILAAGFALVFGFLWGASHEYNRYKATAHATLADMQAAPAERQADGSLVLERAPGPDAKPAHTIPPKAIVERVVEVVVQPYAVDAGKEGGNYHLPEPMKIDLTLIRTEGGGHRVVASSEDGVITGGADVPVNIPIPPPTLKHAAGMSYGGAGSYGAFYQRHVGKQGRWIVGASARTARETQFRPREFQAEAFLGLRW